MCSGRCALLAWWGELSVAGSYVLGHLLLEHLFEDGLNVLKDSGLYVQLHDVVFELAFQGQVTPFSLNPQPSRHYPCMLRQYGAVVHHLAA